MTDPLEELAAKIRDNHERFIGNIFEVARLLAGVQKRCEGHEGKFDEFAADVGLMPSEARELIALAANPTLSDSDRDQLIEIGVKSVERLMDR
jgi:hypothetical protein